MAFAPAHITGLFRVRDHPNALLKGSLGAGVSLSLGVRTVVRAERAFRWKTSIKINGRNARAPVSAATINLFSKRLDQKYHVNIVHEIGVPVGAGYGASGAGALSLSLALNEATQAGLSKFEAGQVAHEAEIFCKTGLGTVLAVAHGGLGIRTKPGAPGIGIVKKIPVRENSRVVSFCIGALSTEHYLTDNRIMSKIDHSGEVLLRKLNSHPTVDSFLRLSRQFSESSGIQTRSLKKLLKALEQKGFKRFAMNVFGEAAFTILPQEASKSLTEHFRRLVPHISHMVLSEIDKQGARIID